MRKERGAVVVVVGKIYVSLSAADVIRFFSLFKTFVATNLTQFRSKKNAKNFVSVLNKTF